MPDSIKTKTNSRGTPSLEGQEELPGDYPGGKSRNEPQVDQQYQFTDHQVFTRARLLPTRPGSRKGNGIKINQFTELAKYFQQETVVVLVKDGESREEAWQRHLLARPQDARADVRIFHRSPESSF